MTLKEKLEFLAKHSDGSEFQYKYVSNSLFDTTVISYLPVRVDDFLHFDFREVEKDKYDEMK